MATYREILSTETDPDSPLTSTLAIAWTENVLSIIEGGTGAPRIYGLAAATVDDFPVLSVTASDNFPVSLSTTTVLGTVLESGATYVLAETTTVNRVTGTVRFKGSHRVTLDDSSQESDLRVLKNGSVVTTWTTNNTTFANRSADIAVVPGDVITWEHRRQGIGTGDSQFSQVEDTASDGYVETNLILRGSDT